MGGQSRHGIGMKLNWKLPPAAVLLSTALCCVTWTWSPAASAQEAVIRKNLSSRLSELAEIDEVRKTPMAGIWEVRSGTDLYYTDAQGNYLLQGELIDTKAQRNLSAERIAEVTAIDFSKLPLNDAFTLVRGNGERQLAVFEDPNCGYCKRFERDLAKVDNVTVYLFLMPVLGPGSVEKSHHVWCAKDPGAAWVNMMQKDVPPAVAQCNTTAIDRNLEFGRKYKITGTPTLVAQDGTRVPGAIDSAKIERLLADASK